MPTRCQPDANQMPRGMRSNATQDANKMPHRGYVVHTCMPEGILGYSLPSAWPSLFGPRPLAFSKIWAFSSPSPTGTPSSSVYLTYLTPLVPDPGCCHRARCNRLSRRRGAGPALFLHGWLRRPQSLPGISKYHTRVARHSPSGQISRGGVFPPGAM